MAVESVRNEPFQDEKLRIAILGQPGLILPPLPSHSIARIIELQIRGLQEQGHEVILLAPGDCRVECEVISICDKSISFHEDRTFSQTQQIQSQLIGKLEKVLKRVDIVHFHSLDIPNFCHTTGFLNSFNFPNVTTIHSCIEISNLDYFNQCANKIISLSYNQRKACPSLNFIGNVSNGLDPTPFQVVETPDNYLCFLGRISSTKKPHLAIQLAIQLGLNLKIAGAVDSLFDKEYFEHYCKPLLKHPLVEYLGELGMRDKIQLLSHAICNLHPTGFRDPCPLVPVEAAYCGTPTLAICRGALPELLEHGKTGVLVEDFAEGFYEIHRCFQMDRLYIAQQARKRFNYQKMVKEYLSIYRRVISNFVSTPANNAHAPDRRELISFDA
jgi:glycosyltransferase involved in cell wall biosynthesis